MEITTKTIVADIVRFNHKTAQIFENQRINFCCGGDKSLDQACMEANVDIDQIMPQLHSVMNLDNRDRIYLENLEADALCDYIEQKHHNFINENVPFLYQKIIKLCNSHGNKHPEVFGLKDLFQGLTEHLSSHLKKGELMFYPHIKNMIKTKNENTDMPDSVFGDLTEFIEKGESEHSYQINILSKIAELTNNYTKPEGGCNTFEVTYRTLEDFDKELQTYIYLEKNVLYPKTLKLHEQISLS